MNVDRSVALHKLLIRLEADSWSLKPKCAVADTPFYEFEFDEDGRLYIDRRQTPFEVVEIGDKKSQDADIRRLKKRA
jgi:hypothetical protein